MAVADALARAIASRRPVSAKMPTESGTLTLDLGHADSCLGLGSEMIVIVVRKHCSSCKSPHYHLDRDRPRARTHRHHRVTAGMVDFRGGAHRRYSLVLSRNIGPEPEYSVALMSPNTQADLRSRGRVSRPSVRWRIRECTLACTPSRRAPRAARPCVVLRGCVRPSFLGLASGGRAHRDRADLIDSAGSGRLRL